MKRGGFGLFASVIAPALALTALIGATLTISVASVRGQRTESIPQVFTYSTIECGQSAGSRLDQITERAIPVLDRAGATTYAVWTPAAAPKDAPFEGLTPKQVVLMAAWPDGRVDAARLDSGLKSLDGITAVHTEVLESIYLAGGLSVPTGTGFYVHREELYRPSDVDEVVRLSREAWRTWEPAWGTRVVGLFRKRVASSETARLLRIAWYRDFEHWTETRQVSRDPESAKRFEARSKLELKGSGRAVATDRLIK